MVVAFHQGVRDEKMLEKLATHDIQDVFALFNLVDKYAKATKGHAWHSPVTQAVKGESKPNIKTHAQGGGNSSNNNNNNKKDDGNQPLDEAPTVVAAATVVGGAVGAHEATNASVSRPIATTVAQSAQCTTPRTVAHRSAGRSISSQNNSVRRCSSRAKMARLPASGRANRKSTRRKRKTWRWSSRMPGGY
jgi:hypothetical protein